MLTRMFLQDFFCFCCFVGAILFSAEGETVPTEQSLTHEELSDEWNTRLEYARLLSYMKKYNESIAEYKKLLSARPTSVVAMIELAKVYTYAKDYQDAVALIQAIPPNKITPEIELILADIATAQKDYPQAEALYEKNLNTNPKESDTIRLKLANVQSWAKEYDKSLENFKILLEKHPQDTQLRRKYAMVLFWAGKDDEAASELKATLNDFQEGSDAPSPEKEQAQDMNTTPPQHIPMTSSSDGQ